MKLLIAALVCLLSISAAYGGGPAPSSTVPTPEAISQTLQAGIQIDSAQTPVVKMKYSRVEVSVLNFIINSTKIPFTSANFINASKMHSDEIEHSCVAIFNKVESWDNTQVTLSQIENWLVQSPIQGDDPKSLLLQSMSSSSSDRTYVPFIATLIDMIYFTAGHPQLGMSKMIELCESGYSKEQDLAIKQAAHLFTPGHDSIFEFHQ